jgi:hypothetical protein
MASKIVVKTLAEVAKIFGLSSSGIGYWRTAGMPGRPGAWDIGKICRWTFGRGPWRSETARDDMLRAREECGDGTDDK